MQLTDSTKSGVRGEKNAVTHLSFPDAATRGKRFDFSFRRKAGREIEHFTAFPPPPQPGMPREHHRPPSNGAPGCRGRRKPPAKKRTEPIHKQKKSTKAERKSLESFQCRRSGIALKPRLTALVSRQLRFSARGILFEQLVRIASSPPPPPRRARRRYPGADVRPGSTRWRSFLFFCF